MNERRNIKDDRGEEESINKKAFTDFCIDFYTFIAVAIFSFIRFFSGNLFESTLRALTVTGIAIAAVLLKRVILFLSSKDTKESRKKTILSIVFECVYVAMMTLIMLMSIPRVILLKELFLLMTFEIVTVFNLVAISILAARPSQDIKDDQDQL